MNGSGGKRLGALSERNYLLILIAVWEFLTAVGALITIYIVVYELWLYPEEGAPSDVFGVALIVALLAFFGLAVAAGVGVLKVKRWGRIVAIIHAALNLLQIPLGTIIGTLILVYMFRSQTREYFKATTE
jgi:hypothetical protein